jgi:hypothetical protein
MLRQVGVQVVEYNQMTVCLSQENYLKIIVVQITGVSAMLATANRDGKAVIVIQPYGRASERPNARTAACLFSLPAERPND